MNSSAAARDALLEDVPPPGFRFRPKSAATTRAGSQRRRLSCAVAAEQCGRRAAPDFEADAGQSLDLAVPLGQLRDDNDRSRESGGVRRRRQRGPAAPSSTARCCGRRRTHGRRPTVAGRRVPLALQNGAPSSVIHDEFAGGECVAAMGARHRDQDDLVGRRERSDPVGRPTLEDVPAPARLVTDLLGARSVIAR